MPIHKLADGSSIEYVEIEQEPRHHVLFQNSKVRCYDTLVKPSDTTLYHRHYNDTFYALIAGGHGAMQEAGDDFKDTVLEPQGTLALMCRSKELVHRVHFKAENKNAFHILGVELLPSGDSSDETPAPDLNQSALLRCGYTHVTKNVWPQIIVHKLTLPPGQTTGLHSYGSHCGVALFLTGAYLRVLEAEGSSPSPFSGGFVAAGSVKWHEGGVKHEIVNIGETELVAMLVHLV